MNSEATKPPPSRRSILTAWLVAALVFAVFSGSGYLYLQALIHESQANLRLALDSQVERQVQVIKDKLRLAQAPLFTLADIVAVRKGDFPEFAVYAEYLLRDNALLSGLFLAPGGVVSAAKPLEGNEAAIGHELLKDPERRREVEQAIFSNQTVLAGPVAMRQGGVGLFARKPVFWEQDGQRRFWGLVVALIRWDAVQASFDFDSLTSKGYAYALERKLDSEPQAQVIAHGDAPLIDELRVSRSLVIPGGAWLLSVSPSTDAMRPMQIKGMVVVLLSALCASSLAMLLMMSRVKFLWQSIELANTNEALGRDIDWRKQVEEQLRKSERRLQESERLAGVGGFERNTDTGVSYWSQNLYRLFGYEPGEIEPSREVFISHVHPDDVARFHAGVRVSLTQGLPFKIDFRFFRADGELRNGLVMAEMLADDGGPVSGYHGCLLDTTLIRQVEQALVVSEEKYRSLHESMRDGFMRISAAGLVVESNTVFRDMTGFSEDELARLSLESLTPPKWRHMENRLLVGQVMQKGYSEVYEKECLRKDGSSFPVSVRTYLKRDADGHIEYYWSILRDISWRKQTEEHLRQARDLAQAANRAKSGFLANMSHEIRTPMNGVRGILQLLQMTELTDEQKEYVESGLEALGHLLIIINDILDFSKIEAGRMDLKEVPVDIRAFCQGIPSFFKHQIESKGLHFSLDMDGQVPERILADPGRLRQVLYNLLGNAVKFTKSGGIKLIVEVGESEDDDRLRLRFAVADTGIGIPAEQMNDLFEPFTQADGSLTRTYQGTGLGLSIVKRLVELMHGHVGMESTLGKGTVVRFDILVGRYKAEGDTPTALALGASVHAASSKVLALAQEQAGHGSLRLLLAEDDEACRKSTRLLLEKFGHTVSCANDGLQAVQSASLEPFDLILMDIQMPIQDGLSAAQAIRTGAGPNARTPIVAMTAYAMPGDRERFLASGMAGYVAKPMNVEELLRTIYEVRSHCAA